MMLSEDRLKLVPMPRDPRDVHTEADASTTPRERLLAFWEGGFATFTLPTSGKVTIGRLQECEICIDHPSVSRRHAELLLGPQLRVVDLASFNGTRVGGARITANEPTLVPPRSVIEIGSTFLVVETFLTAVLYPDFFRDARPAQIRGAWRIPFRIRLRLIWADRGYSGPALSEWMVCAPGPMALFFFRGWVLSNRTPKLAPSSRAPQQPAIAVAFASWP